MSQAEHKQTLFLFFIIFLILLSFTAGLFLSKYMWQAEAEHYKEELFVCKDTPKFDFYNGFRCEDKETGCIESTTHTQSKG
jgi:hypothetical protein